MSMVGSTGCSRAGGSSAQSRRRAAASSITNRDIATAQTDLRRLSATRSLTCAFFATREIKSSLFDRNNFQDRRCVRPALADDKIDRGHVVVQGRLVPAYSWPAPL